jgi:hypothetical protein
MTGLLPSKRCHREVVLTIAVEIGGLDVAHSWPAVEPCRSILPVAQAAQPDHGPLVMISGKELAKIPEQEIVHTIMIDIGQRYV